MNRRLAKKQKAAQKAAYHVYVNISGNEDMDSANVKEAMLFALNEKLACLTSSVNEQDSKSVGTVALEEAIQQFNDRMTTSKRPMHPYRHQQ